MARLSAQALYDSATALQAGDVKAAIAVRNREPREDTGALAQPIESQLGFILQRTPKLLADCPPKILEPLRIAAAMMILWGTSNIREFVTIEGESTYRFVPEAIALILFTHGCILHRLEEMRGLGITRVQLVGSGLEEDCEACRAANGAIFNIDDVPELPLVNCRCKTGYGCGVGVVPVEPD